MPYAIGALVAVMERAEPAMHRTGTRSDSRLKEQRIKEQRIKLLARHGECVVGVAGARQSGKQNLAPARADHDHIAESPRTRHTNAQLGKQPDSARTDQVTTRLVPRERSPVHQRDAAPPRARTRAATLPAGPAPTTIASGRRIQ
jgi:hypothetical protein